MPLNAAAAFEAEPGTTSWPQDVSHEPRLAIGAVVKLLAQEFPATTVSKVRFLEEKGLIKPHRTASGYRQFSRSDVERLRYILRQQRDSYAPLRVIHENLRALDAGHQDQPVRSARVVTHEGKAVLPTSGTVSARDLSDLSGLGREVLENYVKLGLISPDMGGHFPSGTVRLVQVIANLEALGVPARNLRSVRNSAERTADLIDQVTLAVTRRNRPGDRERAGLKARDLAELAGALHEEYLNQAVAALET